MPKYLVTNATGDSAEIECDMISPGNGGVSFFIDELKPDGTKSHCLLVAWFPHDNIESIIIIEK